MTAKNRTDIQSEVDSLLADNVTGDISPSDVRTVHETSKDSNLNLLESTTQTVAGLTNYTGGLQVGGVAVVPVAELIINQESDFPTQDATTITLDTLTRYVIRTAFSTAKKFTGNVGALITADNQFGVVLTYTGTGDMFTGDNNFTIRDITVDCDSAQAFNWTAATAGVGIFLAINVVVKRCAKFGTFNNMQAVDTSGSNSPDADDGITIAGANPLVMSLRQFALISTSATFKGIDLGSAIIPNIEGSNLIFIAPAGAFGISGLASNGNIPAGFIAMISNSSFSGGMTDLENITEDDFRWSFIANSPTKDTNPDALLSLTGNTTETVISSSSTDGSNAVLLAGTWVVQRTSHYSGTTAGRATYDAERDIAVPVTIQATVESASGTNKDIAMYLAVDGTVVASARSKAKVGASDPRTLSVPWQLNFSQTKFVEIFLENQSDSINLIGTDAILRIR